MIRRENETSAGGNVDALWCHRQEVEDIDENESLGVIRAAGAANGTRKRVRE